MSSLLKLRRGSTVAHETFTGADGEVTFNTDTNALVTHDGATAGGFPHMKNADLAASNGSSLVGYMPAGGVATTVQGKLRESVSFADFGCVGIGDETIKLQAALTYASTNSKAIVDYSGKTYNYSTTLNVGAIELIGNFTLNSTSTAIVNITGELTEVGYITVAVAAGASTVTLSSVAGLAADDLLILWNSVPSSYSPHRANYYDGEFVRIANVSGSNVTMQSNLLTGYVGTSAQKVFKSSGIRVLIDGPSFTGSGVFALRVQYADNVVVRSELTRISTFEAALSINKSYNVLIEGGQYYTPYDASGGGYGINVSNSQFVTVRNVDAYGGRHAITSGGDAESGSVPCRYLCIENSILTNNPASGIYSADFHGNTIDSYFKDCTIYGRIGLAGENVSAINCTVHSWPNSAVGPLNTHEIVGGKIWFKDCTAIVGSGSTAIEIYSNVSSVLTANISKPYQVVIEGLDAILNASVVQLVIAYENSGEANEWSLSDFRIRGNVSGLTRLVQYILTAPGIDASRICIENPQFDVSPYTLIVKTGTLLTNTRFTFPTFIGSNVNGSYTKFSDGTMLCRLDYSVEATDISTAFLGGFRTGGLTWTYPQAFITPPVVSITADDATCFSGSISTASLIDVIFFLTAIASQTAATRSAHLVAVGRWY